MISKHKAVLPEQRPDAVPEEAPPPAAAPEGNWRWVAMPIEEVDDDDDDDDDDVMPPLEDPTPEAPAPVNRLPPRREA